MRANLLIATGAVLLVTGVVLAIVGFSSSEKQTRQQETLAPRDESSLFDATVAARSISRGRRIEEGDLATIRIAEPAPAGVIAAEEVLVGAIARHDIAQGQLLTSGNTIARKSDLRSGGDAALLVPPGMRAVALSVSPESAVARLLVPGDRVDVYARVTPVRTSASGAASSPTALTGERQSFQLLQNIEVLSIGQRLSASESGAMEMEARTITLAATPEQVNRLNLMAELGSFYLALRNPQDEQAASSVPLSIADLLEFGRSPVPVQAGEGQTPEKAARGSSPVQIIKGGILNEVVIKPRGDGR